MRRNRPFREYATIKRTHQEILSAIHKLLEICIALNNQYFCLNTMSHDDVIKIDQLVRAIGLAKYYANLAIFQNTVDLENARALHNSRKKETI